MQHPRNADVVHVDVPPVTLPGMSTRGAVVPTSLYWLTGFAGATPCCSDVVASVTLNSLPPSSSP